MKRPRRPRMAAQARSSRLRSQWVAPRSLGRRSAKGTTCWESLSRSASRASAPSRERAGRGRCQRGRKAGLRRLETCGCESSTPSNSRARLGQVLRAASRSPAVQSACVVCLKRTCCMLHTTPCTYTNAIVMINARGDTQDKRTAPIKWRAAPARGAPRYRSTHG